MIIQINDAFSAYMSCGLKQCVYCDFINHRKYKEISENAPFHNHQFSVS